MSNYPRVAIIHDWLTSWGGAEYVLENLLEIYPHADIFTLVYNPDVFRNSSISRHKIDASFINNLPFSKSKWRYYLPLMPFAIEQLYLGDYELLISVSDAVAHGVLSQNDQLHINYILTPMRYAWRLHHQYLKESNLSHGLRGTLAKIVLHYMRLWDYAASSRVDQFVAISNWIADAVWKSYKRPSEIIYPPVNIDKFNPHRKRNDHYLIVSRLVPYKKIRLAVESFSNLQLPLIIVGEGPEFNSLKAQANDNVKLLGWQDDSVVTDLFETAKAYIHIAEEDFGITLVEAQAAGSPVIAYGRGGAKETVIEAETGIFFEDQSSESLTDIVERFEQEYWKFDPHTLRQNAERFRKDRFQLQFKELIEKYQHGVSQTRK